MSKTYMYANVLGIGNSGAYSEPMTSNALGGLANEHRSVDAAAYTGCSKK